MYRRNEREITPKGARAKVHAQTRAAFIHNTSRGFIFRTVINNTRHREQTGVAVIHILRLGPVSLVLDYYPVGFI